MNIKNLHCVFFLLVLQQIIFIDKFQVDGVEKSTWHYPNL